MLYRFRNTRLRLPALPREILARIISMRHEGFSYTAICDALNAEGIPTPTGRTRWRRSYVDRLLHTRTAQEIYHEIETAVPLSLG